MPVKATSLIGDHLAEVRQVGGAIWLALNVGAIIRLQYLLVNEIAYLESAP